MNDALHKKGKELIAMGESICSMAGMGEEKEEKGEMMSDDDAPMDQDDKESKKKMSIAMLSKKFGKGGY